MKAEHMITMALPSAPESATPKKPRASKKVAKPAVKKASKSQNKRATKPTSNKPAPLASGEGRVDTKKAIVLDLLRRKQGATTAEIAKATDWQNHSIRGFISGHVTKKMGLRVESSRNEAGQRMYRIAK